MQIIVKILKYWPKRWITTALVVSLIFYLTLVPRPIPDTNINIPGIDKLVHAIMFGGLAFVACIDKARHSCKDVRRLSARTIVYIAGLSAFLGLSIEFLQQLMNVGRGGDAFDFIADIVGIIIGCFIAIKFLKSYIRLLEAFKYNIQKN